jgi:hypothetical protein
LGCLPQYIREMSITAENLPRRDGFWKKSATVASKSLISRHYYLYSSTLLLHRVIWFTRQKRSQKHVVLGSIDWITYKGVPKSEKLAEGEGY